MKETNIKQIKLINNGSYKLPQYNIGTSIKESLKDLTGSSVLGAASTALNGVTQIASGVNSMNNAVQPEDTQLFTNAKQNVGPYGRYFDTMHLNQNLFMESATAKADSGFKQTELGAITTGASVGSLLGPLGTGIGAVAGGLVGLIGLGKRNSEIEKAKQYAQATMQLQSGYNKQNKSVATSMGMRDEYNMDHSNNISYAAEGKQAFDPKWNYQNGWAHNGEFLYRPSTEEGMTILNGTGTLENAPVYTKPEDVIYTDKFISKITGKNLAKSAEAAQSNLKNGFMPQQLKLLLAALAQELGMYLKLNIHKQYMNQYKCGKMPHYKTGKDEDILPVGSDDMFPDLISTHELNEVKIRAVPTISVKTPTEGAIRTIPQEPETTKYPVLRQVSPKGVVKDSTKTPRKLNFKLSDDIVPYALTGLTSAIGLISNMNRANEIRNRNVSESNPFMPNPYLQSGLAAMKPTLDYSWVSPMRSALQDAKYTYAKNGGITDGMRFTGLNSLYNNYMSAYNQQHNAMMKQYMADKAKWGETMLNAGNAEATRWQQGYTWAKDSANRKLSKRNDDLTTMHNANLQNWYDLAKNYTQLWQFNKNVGLYNKKLDIDSRSLG